MTLKDYIKWMLEAGMYCALHPIQTFKNIFTILWMLITGRKIE